MITFTPPSSLPHLTSKFPTNSSSSLLVPLPLLIHLFHTISTLLESNPYVIIFALDFSKAFFYSILHNAVMDKVYKLFIPDNIYNGTESFFRGHSHCINFGQDISGFQEIMASIIQGSCIGPASYVVTASYLHPVTKGNSMVKYVDDTYLIVHPSIIPWALACWCSLHS
jgi:hypothetical protein